MFPLKKDIDWDSKKSGILKLGLVLDFAIILILISTPELIMETQLFSNFNLC